MTRRSTPSAVARLASAKRPDLDLHVFVEQVLALVARSTAAPFPYLRVKQLTPPAGPFSRSQIYVWLADGTLRGVRIRGQVLVERASVDELLAGAVPYQAKRGRA